ncbi:hypothetical protein CsSME_00034175 [Camellia sinensis var. sinensis]
MKIFDANPDILRAFANSDIYVTVTVANSDIPAVSKLSAAVSCVANNILLSTPPPKSTASPSGTKSLPPPTKPSSPTSSPP